MSKLFDQMLQIAKDAAKETENSENPLFVHQHKDLTDFDRDIIENDAVPGDEYIWAIRGTGHGTDLYRINSNPDLVDFLDPSDNARLFHLKVSDIGQGNIYPIDREQMADLVKTNPNPNRVPRREHIADVMQNILGLKEKRLFTRVLDIQSEQAPGDGAVTIARTEPVRGGLNVTMAQTKAGKGQALSGGAKEYFIHEQDLDLGKNNSLTGTQHFRIKTPRKGYAIKEEISKRSFDQSLKGLERRRSKSADLTP